MLRKKSKIASLLLCLMLIMCSTVFSFASEENPNASATSQNNSVQIIEVGEDWTNPDTGEYFRWIDDTGMSTMAAGEISKSFEFSIKSQVESPTAFVINSTQVDVKSSARITDAWNNPVSNPKVVDYSVKIFKLLGFSNTANFKSATTETKGLSGFTSGDSYYIRIRVESNSSYLADKDYYLTGSGTVKTK